MNNNNSTRNIYNTTSGRTSTGGNHIGANDDEMEMLLNQSSTNNQMTTINIESDMTPSTSQHLQRQQHLQQMRRGDAEATRINMENSAAVNGGEQPYNDERQRILNLFAMVREVRHQLNRSQSLRDAHPIIATANGENPSANAPTRTWRENLYDVLSSPVSPQTNVLRAIFTPSSANIRYDSLPANDLRPENQFHFMFNRQNANQNEGESQQLPLRSHHSNGLGTQTSSSSSASLRLSRQNSRLNDERSLNESSTSAPQTPAADISLDSNAANGLNGIGRRQSNAAGSATNSPRPPQRQASVAGSATAPTIDIIDDADTTAVGEMIVKLVTHFIRYLPFIFIIFVKFIHDHLLGILDILLLHAVVYQLNKSIKEQVAKLNQKSFGVLVRDFILVVCVITYRFILSTSTPDPFGLLINPPGTTITLDLFSTQKTNEVSSGVPFSNSEQQVVEVPLSVPTNPQNSTISVTKAITLGALLYYVAVNDLILKLLTQLIKLIVTMLPSKVIRHKSRARLYASIEYISQFYRALVPMRQWLSFLFESYTGLEVISGILFSSFYMGAKGFEFFERGKPLKKALINFVRNMDYDRKPTKDELEAAGTVCPICHDSYTTPVVLECGHIFCDECVNTWFKREQTCPMCRAKVSDDPTWQDGATTYFYQLS